MAWASCMLEGCICNTTTFHIKLNQRCSPQENSFDDEDEEEEELTGSLDLLAVALPVSARSFVPPQLETHHGADQVHHHGHKQEDDGGGLARLCSAEGAGQAVVEDRIGAEPPAGRVSDVDDSWRTQSQRVML